jgi:hypothetical protein
MTGESSPPKTHVFLIQAKRNDLSAANHSHRFRGFDLKSDLAIRNLSRFIIGKEKEIQAVIVRHAFQSMAASQNKPFNVMNAEVRENVLPRAPLLG